MHSTDEIAAELHGLSFAEQAKRLALFDSYDRSLAMVFVLWSAPTPADRLRVFFRWGCICDAPWMYRWWIAEALRSACAEVNMPDLLEPANRQFYNALPDIVEVWRGCEEGRERGLHWSTDQAMAERFGQGMRGRFAIGGYLDDFPPRWIDYRSPTGVTNLMQMSHS